MKNQEIIWQDANLSLTRYQAIRHKHLIQVLAQMRLDYFCEFPYLYTGHMEDELQSLQSFFNSDTAQIYLLKDTEQIVGLATCIALRQAHEIFTTPFKNAGLDTQNYLYYAEAIIKEDYRNKGISRLYDECLNNYAKSLNIPFIATMTIHRSCEHPMWPKGYKSFDNYMYKMGYEPIANINLNIAWPTMPHGKVEEHPLLFWQRSVK